MRTTSGRRLVLALHSLVWLACSGAEKEPIAETMGADRAHDAGLKATQGGRAATPAVPTQDAGTKPTAGSSATMDAGPAALPTDAAAQDARAEPPVAADAAQPMAAEAGRPPIAVDAGTMTTGMPGSAPSCAEPRPLDGDGSRIHFHHVHMNSIDPRAEASFFEKHYNAKPFDFCRRADGSTTVAARTERAYLLFTQVAQAPDATPNTYLEHIGWNTPDVAGELKRQLMLGAPLSPEGRGQCPEAAAGQAPCNDYWFYLTAPNGARAEIATGPGPATSGFGHVHVIMGEDFTFFERATGGAFHDNAIDDVNLIDSLADASFLDGFTVVETRGKPIDHLGYSTQNLEAEKARVLADGLALAEDISFKPELGFRSFFMKSPKGTWIEIVEDAPFEP
jgi:hypothetical protein